MRPNGLMKRKINVFMGSEPRPVGIIHYDAKAAGINAADARLVESDGAPVALIKRFDRLRNGARIMYMSAATMLGAEATDPGAHSYTDIVDAFRVNGAEAQTDIEELWRRIAFSILITNVGDHLMNHGFLYAAKGKWRLIL